MMYRAIILFISLFVATELFAADAQEQKLDKVKQIVADAKTQSKKESLKEGSRTAWLEEKRQQEAEPPITASKMFQGLGLCIGLFFIVIAVLKRVNGRGLPGKIDKRLHVIERISLSQKTSLVLARLDHRELLISVGSEEVNVLNKSSFPGMASQQDFDQELSVSLEQECETDIPLSA